MWQGRASISAIGAGCRIFCAATVMYRAYPVGSNGKIQGLDQLRMQGVVVSETVQVMAHRISLRATLIAGRQHNSKKILPIIFFFTFAPLMKQ